MLCSVSWPCSPADSMVSVPASHDPVPQRLREADVVDALQRDVAAGVREHAAPDQHPVRGEHVVRGAPARSTARTSASSAASRPTTTIAMSTTWCGRCRWSGANAIADAGRGADHEEPQRRRDQRDPVRVQVLDDLLVVGEDFSGYATATSYAVHVTLAADRRRRHAVASGRPQTCSTSPARSPRTRRRRPAARPAGRPRRRRRATPGRRVPSGAAAPAPAGRCVAQAVPVGRGQPAGLGVAAGVGPLRHPRVEPASGSRRAGRCGRRRRAAQRQRGRRRRPAARRRSSRR